MGNKLKNPVLTKDTKNLLYKGSKHQSENKKKKEEMIKNSIKTIKEISLENGGKNIWRFYFHSIH